MTERFVGSYAFPSWSEDGTKLSLPSTRERLSPRIAISDRRNGSVREFQPDLEFFQRPQWVEHGAALMAMGRTKEAGRGFFRIDPQSGQAALFRSQKELETVFEGVWSRDGKLHFNRYQDQRRGIFRLNIETGEKRVLYVPPKNVLIGMENLALSPDGRYLAFHARSEVAGTGSLMVIPAEGGDARPLLGLQRPEFFPFGSFTDRCFARLITPFPDLAKGLSIPYNQSIQTGLERAFYDVEKVVPQPRLSTVFSPAWSKNTVVRGGVGLFSDIYPAFFAGTMAGNAPNVFTPFLTSGLVDAGGPGSAPAIALASAAAFQREFANGATLAQLRNAIAPVPFSPPSYFSLPQTLRTTKYVEWSLDVQHRVGARNVLTLRYAANHGYDIFLVNPNLNASSPSGLGGLPANVPDARFGGISQLTNNGYTHYNGLSGIYQRGFGHGFQGQVSYTWSHALDTISNGGLGGGTSFSYDSFNTQVDPRSVSALNYSSADYDVRHNMTADFIWEIPVKSGSRIKDGMFAGWSVASKLNARTGTPFSVYTRGVAGFADVLDPGINRSCGHAAIDTPCFRGSQFASAAIRRDLGNQPRNTFRGPGFFQIDSSIYKTVTAGERMRFTFGASAYNLLNHANLANPIGDTSNSGLGLITGTVSGPSGPYGLYGGPSGRAVVLTGKFVF